MNPIGIKMDVNCLKKDIYRKFYNTKDILNFLFKNDVRAIEVPLSQNLNSKTLITNIKKCIKAGFQISIHPYTEMRNTNPAYFSKSGNNSCRSFFEKVLRLAYEVSHLQQTKTVVNIHPAAALKRIPRKKLMDESIAFFEWIHKRCDSSDVSPIAELQISPHINDTIQRIGDNYAELFEIVSKTKVAACWDFGHAYMNSLRFKNSLFPPKELVPLFDHVHCHDVHIEDHYPLVYNMVPWEKFLDILLSDGFQGTVILEVPVEKFYQAGGLKSLTDSIYKLRKKLNKFL